MKNIFTLILIVLSPLVMINHLSAQCNPDIVNCIDTGVPGQICPLELVDGYMNTPYEEVVTVIPPESYDYNGTPIVLSHIKILDVQNTPPGVSFESNATDNLFTVGSAYCILISGTPTALGDYPLKITIQPYIANIPMPYVVTDSTSLSIEVLPENMGVVVTSNTRFSVENIIPNPFTNNPEILFDLPSPGNVELLVWDGLGRQLIEQKQVGQTGNNSISVEATDLMPGMYFYTLSFNEEVRKGTMIKQ